MQLYQYPELSSTIRQHYWHLRFARGFDGARIRKQYRLIEKEKKRLHEAGVDAELVRLLCRHMVNLRNSKAEQKYRERLAQTMQKAP